MKVANNPRLYVARCSLGLFVTGLIGPLSFFGLYVHGSP